MTRLTQDGFISIKALLVVALAFVAAMGGGLLLLEGTAAHRVTIAAGSKDGEAYAVARALGEIVERHHPDIHVEVVETVGSLQNVELLESGRVDLATVQADVSTGLGSRLIARLYPDVFQLLARVDSGIETLADLAGRRVALPPQGSGQYLSFWFLAEHYGLAEGDFHALPMSTSSANWALMDGAVDATFGVRAAGNRRIFDVIQRVGCRLLPIEHAAAMRLKQPSLQVANIPAGSYRGHPPMPVKDLATVGVERLLVASSNLDEQVAGKITRVLFERQRELVNITPLAGFISSPERDRVSLMPLHPGAESYYYRDKPSFFQENAEPIAVVVSVAALMLSGILQLGSRRRRRRVDQYNRVLLRLAVEARGIDDLDLLRSRRERLLDIAGQVVDEAEAGQISPDGFGFFSFTWEVVRGIIVDREKEIRAHGEAPPTKQPGSSAQPPGEKGA